MPIYYASKILQGAETNYESLEKQAFALVIAARKMRLYFLGHPIVVLTNQPIKRMLDRSVSSTQYIRWAIEQSEFNLSFQVRTSYKGQVLVNFLA